jgi:hypothetical protein
MCFLLIDISHSVMDGGLGLGPHQYGSSMSLRGDED